MEPVTRVVLALDAPEVLEELLHFLDRSGAARVLATVSDAQQVEGAIRHLEPDLVLAEPRLAPLVPSGTPCIAIASRESVAALRAAIDAGVRAFMVWPLERDELLERVRAFAVERRALERRAVVIAVHASRGGAGCTFLATHLALAMALADRACVLVDIDPWGDDVASALGIPEGADGIHSLDELVGVAAELTPERFEEAVWRHPAGFRTVIAARDGASIDEAAVRQVVDLAAASTDAVILHAPSALDAVTRWCLTGADAIVEVLALDVMSFRASSRSMARLAPDGATDRVRFVVNRATRAEVSPSDVERVFERPATATVPFDGTVPRLQDHGALLPRRSRTVRVIARLGEQLVRDADPIRGAA